MFANGLDAERFSFLYSFVPAPEQLDTMFLGLFDLNAQFFPLAIVAGALQFLQLKQMQPKGEKKKKNKDGKPDISSIVQKQMMYFLPILIVWLAWTLPSAFGLYIATTTVFSMWQHWFISRKEKSTQDAPPKLNEPAGTVTK
jgi:YidC/Oxa1 family membrane protein insertase